MSDQPDYVMQAQYECLACHKRWTQHAGMVTCSACGSSLVRWTNHPLNAEREAQR